MSSSGTLIHIKEAHESGEDCFCPSCGCRMIKRCGKIRTWHFAHDRNENKECSYESYLHEFAKLSLKQWFEESTSIMLHYEQPHVCALSKECKWKDGSDKCSIMEEKSIDLKRFLTHCREEATIKVDNARFRADLYWFNPQNPNNDILVEIKVTHGCTQEKIESQSRIIEFEVHSEEDVEKIKRSDIRENDMVKFYGFNLPAKEDDTVPARYRLIKLTYYKSGKIYTNDQCNCQNYMNHPASALVEITTKNDDQVDLIPFWAKNRYFCFSVPRFYSWCLSLLKERGYDIPSCFLCKNFHKEGRLCALKQEEVSGMQNARQCNAFCENPKAYQRCAEELAEFHKSFYVDIWKKE